MVNVFEVEANASQDANYREHLNRNWQNGNTEFDKIEGLLNTLEEKINGYQEEFDQLKQNGDAFTRQVNDLNETIEKQDARISKLENAVFGYGEYEVNYETPPKTIDHVLEINTDSNPKLKGE